MKKEEMKKLKSILEKIVYALKEWDSRIKLDYLEDDLDDLFNESEE